MTDDILLAVPAVERFDVFDVQQVTRGTALEAIVAADMVSIGPHTRSQVHRHQRSETVLYLFEGAGRARIGERHVEVRAGDRIVIGKGVYHGFETAVPRPRRARRPC